MTTARPVAAITQNQDGTLRLQLSEDADTAQEVRVSPRLAQALFDALATTPAIQAPAQDLAAAYAAERARTEKLTDALIDVTKTLARDTSP